MDKAEMVADGLASVAEAAKFLSMGRSKVYELMAAGLLPWAKMGRSRRIPWRAIKDFAQKSLVSA